MSLSLFLQSDIERIEDELKSCDKIKDRDLITYLIAREHTLKEILTLIKKGETA